MIAVDRQYRARDFTRDAYQLLEARGAGTNAAIDALVLQAGRLKLKRLNHVAELMDTASERAIRWTLMVLYCEPLAIALTCATSARTQAEERTMGR
jgi:hypothetical protein